MRLQNLSVVLATALIISASAEAVVYDGIDFPSGDMSFADAVLGYQPTYGGGPAPADPNYVNPLRALGPPDFVPDSGGSGGEFNGAGAVALGHGGRIEVRFTDNVITNSGTMAADLALFERGVDEAFFVAVRPANATTRALLGSLCATANFCALTGVRTPVNDAVQIDLDAEFPFGYAAGALRFDAVQLTDSQSQGASGGDQVGPDIDAGGGIASAGIACGDGWVEGNEACDDGGVADGDGCSAGCQIETCWACDGEPSVCAIDDGGACDDGEPCTTGDVCAGLICTGGPPPNCDDNNVCTDDSCLSGQGCTWVSNTASCDDGSTCSTGDHCAGGECVGTAVERSGCHQALGTTQLRIFNRFDDSKDSIVWVWAAGTATPLSAFGDPPSPGGSFELCVFDGPPSARRLRAIGLAEKGQSCGGAPCWRAQGDNRFLFKNPEAPHGLRQLFLKSGGDAQAKVLAKGRGPAINLPTDLTMLPPVRAELRDTSSTNECWDDVYTTVIRNDAERFKAKQ